MLLTGCTQGGKVVTQSAYADQSGDDAPTIYDYLLRGAQKELTVPTSESIDRSYS